MEKKLGVVFTTIVTRIYNTITLSFFSNPNTNIQTTLKTSLSLSLSTIPTISSSIYLFTDPLSISVLDYNYFWLWVFRFHFSVHPFLAFPKILMQDTTCML